MVSPPKLPDWDPLYCFTSHCLDIPCTTKLAQSTSQYHVVLQSLHKALPSTTLYYKACTSYFPVLLCTTKLAKSISQYYFGQKSLQKVFLSTTLYYKVAQSTSQYYFVVQSLHKARSITTLLWQPMPMFCGQPSPCNSGKNVFNYNYDPRGSTSKSCFFKTIFCNF